MSNQQINTNEKTFFLWQTLRSNKTNGGTIIQLTVSKKTGTILITMANQKGFNQQGLPIFDYDNKTVFSLSEMEIMQLYKLYRSNQLNSITFPHLKAKIQKNIIFETNLYNNQKQLKIFVIQGDSKFNIFLNDFEAEILLKNLVDSTSLYNQMSAVLALKNI